MSYRYMILDSRSTAVARGYLESPLDASIWYIRVLDGAEERVMEHEYLQLVSMEESAPAKMGRILRRRNDVISLEPIEDLDDEIQSNLRVQVKFSTYIYPQTGKCTKRLPVISHDLSCGGIAFYCSGPLEERDQFEIVIPITTQPLVLKAQILHLRPSNSNIPMFSAKFVDMVREEEAMVREAVFGRQIQMRASGEDLDDTAES